jgi:hypothetical protein
VQAAETGTTTGGAGETHAAEAGKEDDDVCSVSSVDRTDLAEQGGDRVATTFFLSGWFFLRAMVSLTYEEVRLKYEAVRPGFSRTIQLHFSRPDRRRTRASQSRVTDGQRKTRFFLQTKFVFLTYHGFVIITTSSRIISRDSS